MSRSVLVVPAGFERTTIITPLVDNTSMIAYINPGTVVRGRVRCGDEVCDITLPAGFTVFDMFRAIYDCIGEEWTDPANISAIDGKWIFGKI